jgi:hypothetical protein
MRPTKMLSTARRMNLCDPRNENRIGLPNVQPPRPPFIPEKKMQKQIARRLRNIASSRTPPFHQDIDLQKESQVREGTSIIFPGFIIQSGSRACLMDFMTPRVSSPTSINNASFFPMPIPCSPCSRHQQNTPAMGCSKLTVQVPSISNALVTIFFTHASTFSLSPTTFLS